MPPVAILENNRSQRKKTLACAVSLAFSKFSNRMISCIQVWRLVHSGQFSLTTSGPETTRDSAERDGMRSGHTRSVSDKKYFFILLYAKDREAPWQKAAVNPRSLARGKKRARERPLHPGGTRAPRAFLCLDSEPRIDGLA